MPYFVRYDKGINRLGTCIPQKASSAIRSNAPFRRSWISRSSALPNASAKKVCFTCSSAKYTADFIGPSDQHY